MDHQYELNEICLQQHSLQFSKRFVFFGYVYSAIQNEQWLCRVLSRATNLASLLQRTPSHSTDRMNNTFNSWRMGPWHPYIMPHERLYAFPYWDIGRNGAIFLPVELNRCRRVLEWVRCLDKTSNMRKRTNYRQKPLSSLQTKSTNMTYTSNWTISWQNMVLLPSRLLELKTNTSIGTADLERI